MLIDKRTGEKFLSAIQFDYKNTNALVDSVLNEAEYIHIYINGEKSYAKFRVCFCEEEITVRHEGYLLKSEKTSPRTMPPLHYYKSVDEADFSKNFIPSSVTE